MKKIIELEVGDLDRISFPSNPSTGYVWMLASMPNEVYLVDIDDIPPTNPMPGKQGTRVFTIVGVKPGKGRLVFVLARPWDPKPVRKMVYRVVVEKEQDPGPIVLYGVPMTEAKQRGDLDEMKAMAAQARQVLDQHGDIKKALAELEDEIAKAEKGD